MAELLVLTCCSDFKHKQGESVGKVPVEATDVN